MIKYGVSTEGESLDYRVDYFRVGAETTRILTDDIALPIQKRGTSNI